MFDFMQSQKKVFLYAEEVCVKRSLDAAKIRDFLENNGYHLVYHPSEADIIFFVTCAVTKRKTDFSFQKIQEFKQYPAELIIGGCLPAIEPEELNRQFHGKSIATKNLHKIDDFFPTMLTPFSRIEDTNLLFENMDKRTMVQGMSYIFKPLRICDWIDTAHRQTQNFALHGMLQGNSPILQWIKNKHFHIRISWGCRGNCSYCAIKKAVGPLVSKPLVQCVYELEKGLKQGYTYFALVADDVGAYGLDIDTNFHTLLDALTKRPESYFLSILDVNPNWFVRYLKDFYKVFEQKKIIYIDIPFQSGSSRILKLMQRYHNIDKIKESYLDLRHRFPEIALSTQNIIGFPTETTEDFHQTLDLINEVGFNAGYLYRFALKTGTKAEGIQPLVSDEEIALRMNYAKKYLKAHGFHVFYRSIFYSPRFFSTLGFIKK